MNIRRFVVERKLGFVLANLTLITSLLVLSLVVEHNGGKLVAAIAVTAGFYIGVFFVTLRRLRREHLARQIRIYLDGLIRRDVQ